MLELSQSYLRFSRVYHEPAPRSDDGTSKSSRIRNNPPPRCFAACFQRSRGKAGLRMVQEACGDLPGRATPGTGIPRLR
jgi:hypothetical protein